MTDPAELIAHTTAVLRARDAYSADENVRAGICAICGNHPIYQRARMCEWCRKERAA